MDILASLLDGTLHALEPVNLGLAFLGVVIGLFIGAMPGLGSVNGVAILLPFTFVIQDMTGTATSPMIFLAAIYYGAMYGGAISSITLGIPGASTAVATVFDGRPLALAGKAEKALVVAALASFAGGTVANILFTGFAPALARIALDFGNPEIFALMLLAFATFVGLGGDDIPKTIKEVKAGRVEFKMDKTGNIVIVIGKKSFTSAQLTENAQAALSALVKAQPAGFSGGRFIKSITMSASMSPGVAVDLKPYSAAVATA